MSFAQRLALSAFIVAIGSCVQFKLALNASQVAFDAGDKSAFAWTGFAPYIFPIFVAKSAAIVLPVFLAGEIAIALVAWCFNAMPKRAAK
jgi:hypothetical protein